MDERYEDSSQKLQNWIGTLYPDTKDNVWEWIRDVRPDIYRAIKESETSLNILWYNHIVNGHSNYDRFMDSMRDFARGLRKGIQAYEFERKGKPKK